MEKKINLCSKGFKEFNKIIKLLKMIKIRTNYKKTQNFAYENKG